MRHRIYSASVCLALSKCSVTASHEDEDMAGRNRGRRRILIFAQGTHGLIQTTRREGTQKTAPPNPPCGFTRAFSSGGSAAGRQSSPQERVYQLQC